MHSKKFKMNEDANFILSENIYTCNLLISGRETPSSNFTEEKEKGEEKKKDNLYKLNKANTIVISLNLYPQWEYHF